MASKRDPAQIILEWLLLRRAVQGDSEAFVSLVCTHSDDVYAIARNLSASDTEAFELTQGAFQFAWIHLHEVPAEMSFRAFVSRFLVRNAVERLRCSAAAASSTLDGSLRSLGTDRRATRFAWGWPEMQQLAGRRDIVERLGDALAALDPDDRAAFVLQVVEEIPADEAADILEVPVSTVRRRTHFACLLVSASLFRLSAESRRPEARQARTWSH